MRLYTHTHTEKERERKRLEPTRRYFSRWFSFATRATKICLSVDSPAGSRPIWRVPPSGEKRNALRENTEERRNCRMGPLYIETPRSCFFFGVLCWVWFGFVLFFLCFFFFFLFV